MLIAGCRFCSSSFLEAHSEESATQGSNPVHHRMHSFWEEGCKPKFVTGIAPTFDQAYTCVVRIWSQLGRYKHKQLSPGSPMHCMPIMRVQLTPHCKYPIPSIHKVPCRTIAPHFPKQKLGALIKCILRQLKYMHKSPELSIAHFNSNEDRLQSCRMLALQYDVWVTERGKANNETNLL